MNPYYRLCVSVIRIGGAAFLLVSIMDVAAEWFRSSRLHTPFRMGYCIWQGLLFLVGIVILVKSSAWARSLANYLDD